MEQLILQILMSITNSYRTWPHLSPRQVHASSSKEDKECGVFSLLDEEALEVPSGAASQVSSILKIGSGTRDGCGRESMLEFSEGKDPDFDIYDTEHTMRCFPSGDPRCAWRLPSKYILMKDVSAAEREKCAILGGILMLSSLNNPDSSETAGQIMKALLADFIAMLKCPELGKESPKYSHQLDFKIACIHEFTSRSGSFEIVQGCPSLQRAVVSKGLIQDNLFLCMKEILDDFASSRRPGASSLKYSFQALFRIPKLWKYCFHQRSM